MVCLPFAALGRELTLAAGRGSRAKLFTPRGPPTGRSEHRRERFSGFNQPTLFSRIHELRRIRPIRHDRQRFGLRHLRSTPVVAIPGQPRLVIGELQLRVPSHAISFFARLEGGKMNLELGLVSMTSTTVNLSGISATWRRSPRRLGASEVRQHGVRLGA